MSAKLISDGGPTDTLSKRAASGYQYQASLTVRSTRAKVLKAPIEPRYVKYIARINRLIESAQGHHLVSVLWSDGSPNHIYRSGLAGQFMTDLLSLTPSF